MDWRQLSHPQRMEIVRMISAAAVRKYEAGAREYGNTFQGDPLQHLEEELLDGLFYVQMAKRERASLGATADRGSRDPGEVARR